MDADGTVLQVSYGTPIGLDEDFYKNIPCYPMTYGQAMMILAIAGSNDLSAKVIKIKRR